MKTKEISLLIIVVVVTVVSTLLFTGLLPQITKRVYRNQEITTQVQKNIHQLNEQVIADLMNENFTDFYSITTDKLETSLKEKLAPTGDPFARLRNILAEHKFTPVDEYYVTLYQIRDNEQLKLKVDTDLTEEAITLRLNSVSSEMYVSFLTSGGESINHLLALVYTRQQGSWRLTGLNCRDYAYHGKNAVDYYQQAEQLAGQEQIVSAYLYTVVAEELSPPSDFVEYNQQSAINQLTKELDKKIANQFSYPITVDTIDNPPEIFRIGIKNLAQGLTPVIKYQTNLSLDNPGQLEAEADKITQQLPQIFPGLTQNFDYLAYQIYAKEDTDRNYYGLVVDLSETASN